MLCYDLHLNFNFNSLALFFFKFIENSPTATKGNQNRKFYISTFDGGHNFIPFHFNFEFLGRFFFNIYKRYDITSSSEIHFDGFFSLSMKSAQTLLINLDAWSNVYQSQ